MVSQASAQTVRLLETLAIDNGQVQQLHYHQLRYLAGCQHLASLGQDVGFLPAALAPLIDGALVGVSARTGLMRCRIVYGAGKVEVMFYPYRRKTIHSYRLIACDTLDYTYKYADRRDLDALFAKRDGCDDIIIVKDGKLTDSSIGNLLFLKNGIWYTPDTPLLAGTMRAQLLAMGCVKPATISVQTLFDYEQLMMVNALNPFDARRALTINSSSIVL